MNLYVCCSKASGRNVAPQHETRKMTDNEAVWEKITVAPYNCDLELAVIEGDHVHPLVFACRRASDGWIKVSTRERVSVSPTHWHRWRTKD